MTDLISIAASGLGGYRAALETVSENVANANSEGFARRDIELRARAPFTGSPTARPELVGLGVGLAGVRRAHDAFLSSDARTAHSDHARHMAASTWLSEIETALGSGDAAAGPAITAFYHAAGDVASDPGSEVKRNLFLRSADNAASRFRDTASGLANIDEALQREAAREVAAVNDLASALATVNDHLRRTAEGTGASAGLMDERDRLLDEISAYAHLEVREGARGVVDVRLGDGNGPRLVSGGTSARLISARGNAGLTVQLAKGLADLGGFLTGGSIAGLLGAGRQVDRSRSVLDQLSTDFANTVNAAHALGVTLSGAPGEALFTTETVRVAGSPANTGTAAIAVTVADGGAIAAGGYGLFRDGTTGTWVLSRRDGTASVAAPAAPLALDGLSVEISGAGAGGDHFEIDRATGAAGIALRIEDPNEVAAANPFVAGPSIANAGSGAIAVTPDASAALPAAARYAIVFTTPTGFEIRDGAGVVLAAVQPFAPGASIMGNGFSFTLTGAPVQGDRFDIAPGVNAAGDGSAMARLVATRFAPIGLSTFEERWDREAGRIATRLSETNTGLAAAEAADTNALAAREARSGVDLDTQAADLIRFQQAYQASAKVVSTARDIFDSLLGIG